jgi:hypothetical protein
MYFRVFEKSHIFPRPRTFYGGRCREKSGANDGDRGSPGARGKGVAGAEHGGLAEEILMLAKRPRKGGVIQPHIRLRSRS